MDLYRWSFILCAILTAGVTLVARTGSSGGAKGSVAFGRFQRTFLGVYYIAMTADWLQGPYVYALYSSYGFSKHDIAVLFVGGFGASMVFGTFVGAMADRLGRKRMCQLYCLLYIGSCATKHSSEYYTLMLGRVLGGVATSLLFSSFESWLVCEHNARGYDPQLLGDTFSLMYFGNSLCAIVAGIVAEAAADAQPLTPLSAGGAWHYGGYCSPFDLSAACLFVCLGAITSTWSENYGARSAKGADTASALRSALALMKRDPNIWLIGAVVSLFEGSMYIFVFNWTPALSAGSKTTPPFGLIFATFMVACMGGSSLFSILSRKMSAAAILRVAFAVAAAALAVPMWWTELSLILAAFLVFEAVVGVYWPCIGTIKSRVVPEDARATMYNIFRVPLNAVVLGVLLNQIATATAFFYCTLMLAVCAGAIHTLASRMPSEDGLPRHAADEKEDGGLLKGSSGSDDF